MKVFEFSMEMVVSARALTKHSRTRAGSLILPIRMAVLVCYEKQVIQEMRRISGGTAKMRSLMIATAVALAALGSNSESRAADYSGSVSSHGAYFCPWSGAATILSLPDEAAVEEAVHVRFDESVAVAGSPQAINNRAPVFIWATETKVACGKAIGYLKGHFGSVNEDHTLKCDCYYQRMRSFMGQGPAMY